VTELFNTVETLRAELKSSTDEIERLKKQNIDLLRQRDELKKGNEEMDMDESGANSSAKIAANTGDEIMPETSVENQNSGDVNEVMEDGLSDKEDEDKKMDLNISQGLVNIKDTGLLDENEEEEDESVEGGEDDVIVQEVVGSAGVPALMKKHRKHSSHDFTQTKTQEFPEQNLAPINLKKSYSLGFKSPVLQKNTIHFERGKEGGDMKITFKKAEDYNDEMEEKVENCTIPEEFPDLKLEPQQSVNTKLKTINEIVSPLKDQQQMLKMERDRKIADIQKHYAELNHNLNEKIREEYANMKLNLDGKLVCKLIGHIPTVFKIENVDTNAMRVCLKRLFDCNKIRMDLNRQHGLFKSFDDILEEDFYFLGDNESEVAMSDYGDVSKTFTIKYQVLSIDGTRECMPIEISPPNISLLDYEINYDSHNNRISRVQHRIDGPVLFNATEIDLDCGLVQRGCARAFTQRLGDEVFNIIHLHIDDTNHNLPIDVVYLDDDCETIPEDKLQFTSDQMGVMLRYKLFIKQGKIFRLVYNEGEGLHKEVQFEEEPFQIGMFVNVPNYEGHNYVAEIMSIPHGMLGRKTQDSSVHDETVPNMYNKEFLCQDRHLEELPGFIDLRIFQVDGQLMDEPRYSALPACLCVVMDEKEKQFVLDLMEVRKREKIEMQEKVDSSTKNEVALIFSRVKLISENIDLDTTNKEHLKDTQGELVAMDERLNTLSTQISALNDEEVNTAVATTKTKIATLQRRVATSLRF